MFDKLKQFNKYLKEGEEVLENAEKVIHTAENISDELIGNKKRINTSDSGNNQ